MWRLALLLAACTEPQYVSGRLHCAPSGRACPDDFYCGAGGLCWRNGSGPELGVPDDLSAAAPSLCPGSFKICDGFEEPAINSRWSQDTSGGAFTLDQTRAYRGSTSLHLHTNAAASASADPFTNLLTHNAFPLSGTAYVRAFFWFPSSGYPAAFNQVFNFSNEAGEGVAFGTKNGRPVLNDYSTPASYQESAMAGLLPTDQWVCLALSVAQTGATGTIKLLVGDVEVGDVTVSTAGTPTMTHVYIGLDWVNNPASFPATDVWIDEVVINDSPVNCSM